jgi:cell division protein FtsN
MKKMLIRYLTLLTMLYIFIPSVSLFGQNEYDEISVFIDVRGVGAGDISAVIKGEELYLPVTDLFDFLKIRNVPSKDLESITGFFINPDATYSISRTDNQIRYQDKVYKLEPGDLIRTESNLYLKSSYFGKVFGLDCVFNFRSLSATINSKLELPIIREMKLEEMRKNLTHLKGDLIADTTIGRTSHLFKFGMADWSAISTEEINGASATSINMNIGAMIAGGEANASLYYNSNETFSDKQQYYQWRYVNNDFKPLRQIVAGKIASNAISSIYSPVIGVQFTNTPTTYRRSFGSYTLSNKTEPGWIVELYVNNVLVDYVKSDASGFYTFQVPLVYGNSVVKLKFYGPWGEERTQEQNINIPFNFLPEKTLEYTLSAGIVEDTLASRYSKLNVNYGVTRSLTVGAGIEYLSSVLSGPSMPFMNASLRITNNLLLSGEYTYGVRTKGTLSYQLPSNIQLDLNYTNYNKDQKAINFNYKEERRAIISIPLRIGKVLTYQRLSVNQIVLPSSQYTTGEWLFSGSILGVSTNLTTSALFADYTKPFVYSSLSLAFRLPAGFVIMPQAQYGYTQNKLISIKAGLEKHIHDHAFLNMSVEQIFSTNLKLAEVGFRYDFSFAQVGASVRQSDKKTTLIQYARGSLINDRKTRYLGADNRTNVGKGGISIVAFLDLNGNGKKDPGEPKAHGLNLHANGGRIEKSERDSTIRILGLEPYTTCFIELDPNSFENVAWRLQKPTLNVYVDPDILKLIEIPITVAGEANGNVFLQNGNEKNGLGRIILNIRGAKLRTTAKSLTEDNGYFSYFGLAPGKYTVRLDTVQLRRLDMRCEPDSIQFAVAGNINGDIVSGLDFILNRIPGDTTRKNLPFQAKPVIKKDTTFLIVHEVTQELVTISKDSYAIQMGAFKEKKNADAYRKKIGKIIGKPVVIVSEDGYYKVRISEINDRKEVDDYISVLHKNGVNELWVISLKAKHQQWVVTEKQDTVTKISDRLNENPSVAANTEIEIQLGAFRLRSNAINLKDQLTNSHNNKVVIVSEGGYYKVRIIETSMIDQTVLEEMKKLEPTIGKLGIKDIWIVPPQKPRVEEPEEIHREPLIDRVEWNREIPALFKPETTQEQVAVEKIVAPRPQPTISLHIGTYHKHSEALRVQRRIISKLKLPVEIIKEYDYYHVLVTGFYTREETYKYYPELAGLGYPGVTLIENK